MRVLNFADGFPSNTAPALEEVEATAVKYVIYPDDATYELNHIWVDGACYYNSTTQRVRVRNATRWVNQALTTEVKSGESEGAPRDAVAITTIAILGTDHEIIFIQGSGGDVSMTASPQVQAGTFVGQKLTMWAKNDGQRITFADGLGLDLKAIWTGYNNSILELYWSGTIWTELSRSA